MKKLAIKAISLLLAAAMAAATATGLVGCSDTNEVTPVQTTFTQSTEGSWTVLIYLCGSTLESKSGAATDNINELLAADIPDNINIVLQTGGTSSWETAEISPATTDRYVVRDNALQLAERIPETQNFGDSATLTDFVKFGTETYPADHTALILWDHGGGTMKGICYDENYDFDYLSLAELSTALEDAALSQKLDFIGMDACLMATYECASAVAPYANYLVASQEKEPAGGWDYQAMVEALTTDDLYGSLMTAYAKKSSQKDYYTLSCFDLSGIDDLNSMISDLAAQMEAVGKRETINSINDATTFGLSGSGLFDLGNLFDHYGIAGSYEGLVSSINGSQRETATGLSIYFPLYDSQMLEDYLEISQNEEYSRLLTTFDESSSDTIHFLSYAEVTDNKLSFALEEDSLNNFAEAEYVLFGFDTSGKIEIPYILGKDADVEIDDNQVTVSFDGYWVEFGGKQISCTILDRSDLYTIYQAPISVNGEIGRLLFSYNTETWEISIIGVSFESDDYGRIVPLEEGDVVCVARRTALDNQVEDVYSSENEFVFSDQTVSVELLPDGIYQYTAFVRDVYGTDYTAGTAVVEIENGELSVLFTSSDEMTYPDLG